MGPQDIAVDHVRGEGDVLPSDLLLRPVAKHPVPRRADYKGGYSLRHASKPVNIMI